MRKATVYLNHEAVGELIETPDSFIFRYDDTYITRPNIEFDVAHFKSGI
ncbi:hypothetical protein [Runella rosea]|nr:hypothetical protein [Runella rosea]